MAGILVHRQRRGALGPAVVALAALAALAAPGLARPDGFMLRAEPGYSASRTETTAEGITTDVENTAILQKYALTLDKSLLPLVRLGAGGLLDWTQGTTTSPTLESDTDAKRWTGYGRLDLGNPRLGGGAGYDRREESNRFEPHDGTTSSTRLINDVVTAYAVLTPEGLPAGDLRLSRSTTHDRDRMSTDRQEDQLLLNARYVPIKDLELRYAFRATDSVDRISQFETLQLSNLLRAAYQHQFLERRLSTYVSYDATRLDSRTTISGPGGAVLTQQFPIRGFSKVEVFPEVAERIVLDQNPALIDANLTASAGIDIGFSRSVASDNRPRHMGLQFADAVTPVTALYVWVDRPLPADVAAAYAAPGRWRAFQSDDNQVWTPVAVGPVVFGVFLNRFEITIAETRARYLKVVTTPLPTGVTFDQSLASVFVTEMQAYRVQQAADVKGRRSSTQGNLNGALKYELASVKGLSYDLATSVRHGTELEGPTWFIVNGLAYIRRLRPTLLLSARLDHSDSDEGRGHEAGTRYAVTLGANPLPTLTASAGVNGAYEQTVTGNELRNAVLGTVTADLYRGVAATASGSATYGRSDTGRTLVALQTSETLSLVPHRTLSMTGSFAATDTRIEGGGAVETHDSLGRAEGTASFTPFRALYVSASVSRFLYGRLAPDTLANIGVTVSPLPGGPLLLRFNYQESLDTGQELRTRLFGPALRWTIRPRWYVDVTYTHFDTTTPTVETKSRVFFASLFAAIGR